MSIPTHEDAMVMVGLMGLLAQSSHQDAFRFVWGPEHVDDYDEFAEKYPAGSEEFGQLITFCGFFESLGALWANDLFNNNLLNDWLYVPLHWNRVKGFALGRRKELGVELIYEHFEAMAKAQEQ